uniref:Mannan endo-1,4-beta-mannosidase n=1 Tax=Kalanchoe fedtschenkoi TaxID=63787 RepID=A0A7N0TTR0_KALFE
MRNHFHSFSLLSMVSTTAFLLVSILFVFWPPISLSLPLSVNGRWITDDATGSRVKLHCANWPGHIDTMVPEGLDKQPLDSITSTVAALGFNCVRLTYAIFMYTRPEYGQLTLSQSFDNLHLSDAKAAVAKLNPSLVDLKVGDVHEAVINSLGNKSVMVIYDNHISRPKWCCSEDDGNGFFRDADFDPAEWLAGLNASATRYKDNQWVIN